MVIDDEALKESRRFSFAHVFHAIVHKTNLKQYKTRNQNCSLWFKNKLLKSYSEVYFKQQTTVSQPK